MSIPVVICDDSSFARKQMARALPAGWDIEVTFATNGIEGVEAIRAGKGDILFLDLTMPELDGFGVLEAIRNQDLHALVIVVSGDIQPDSYERVMSLGALEFIKKPIDAEKLTTVLNDYGILRELTQTQPAINAVKVDLFDWCQELTNVAMGQAADQLSHLLKAPVTLSLPEVRLLNNQDLCNTLLLDSEQAHLSVIGQGFVGREIAGETMVILTDSDEQKLSQLLNCEPSSTANRLGELELELSALLMGALLKGWSQQLDIEFSVSHPQKLRTTEPPHYCIGKGGELSILAVIFEYDIEQYGFHCNQVLLFTNNSIKTLNRYADLAID